MDSLDINKDKLLTMDPNILLSTVNMKLRDEYGSVEQFCKAYELDKSQLFERLNSIGYEYNSEHNQFKPQEVQ